MSRSLDIFLKTDIPLDTLAGELAALLQAKLDLHTEADEVYYEAQTDRITTTLGKHALEDDRDMLFSEYDYQISIIPHNLGTEEQREQWRFEFGNHLYEQLKMLNKYGLMMVDDLQVKLKEDHPL